MLREHGSQRALNVLAGLQRDPLLELEIHAEADRRDLDNATIRPMKRLLFPIVIAVVAAVAIGRFVGGFLEEFAERKANKAPPASVSDQTAPIIATMTIQPTEHTSEAELDIDTLERLEQHMMQTTLERGRSNFAKQGFDPKTYNPKIDVSSVYTISGGKRLAIIKMSEDSRVRTVWIMGFRGGQFLRVTCIRASNHDIPVFSGECGQKVSDAFYLPMKPQAR